MSQWHLHTCSIYLKKWSLQYFLWHVNFLIQNSVLVKVPVVGLVESTYNGGYSYFKGPLFQFRESALYSVQEQKLFGCRKTKRCLVEKGKVPPDSITAQHSLSSATRG